MTASRTISTEELDRRFDEGEDLEEHFNMANPVVRNPDDVRRVSFNMPNWLVDAIDKEAKHLAIPRQSGAITWLAERARQEKLAL